MLSTILAVIKGQELWRERFRIEIGSCFTGDPDVGNKVFIRNLSLKPLILTSWEILYGSGIWPFQKETTICDSNYDAGDSTITPDSTHTLAFRGESHFEFNSKKLKGRSVYIRLHIAGRKAIRRKLL